MQGLKGSQFDEYYGSAFIADILDYFAVFILIP